MEEIIIDENEDVKSTFSIEKFAVVFRDYDKNEDGSADEISLFSISVSSFEIAVRAWNESRA